MYTLVFWKFDQTLFSPLKITFWTTKVIKNFGKSNSFKASLPNSWDLEGRKLNWEFRIVYRAFTFFNVFENFVVWEVILKGEKFVKVSKSQRYAKFAPVLDFQIWTQNVALSISVFPNFLFLKIVEEKNLLQKAFSLYFFQKNKTHKKHF